MQYTQKEELWLMQLNGNSFKSDVILMLTLIKLVGFMAHFWLFHVGCTHFLLLQLLYIIKFPQLKNT